MRKWLDQPAGVVLAPIGNGKATTVAFSSLAQGDGTNACLLEGRKS